MRFTRSGVFHFLRTTVQDLLDSVEKFILGLAITPYVDPFFPAAHRSRPFPIDGGFIRAVIAAVVGESLTLGGIHPLIEDTAADQDIRSLLGEPEAGELTAAIGGRSDQIANARRVRPGRADFRGLRDEIKGGGRLPIKSIARGEGVMGHGFNLIDRRAGQ